jgi:hypothetical protein
MKTSRPRAMVYRVKSVDGGWDVFDHGGRRLSSQAQPKGDAVGRATELARSVGAPILIYRTDGKLESAFFYRQEAIRSPRSAESIPFVAHQSSSASCDGE